MNELEDEPKPSGDVVDSDSDQRLESIELAMAAPEVSTLGQAVIRRRLRAALLGEEPEALRVDRFVLDRELGRGGMGTVWLARDEQLDRPVALKFLRETVAGEGGEQRLFREAQGLAKLSHPNVIPVFDVGRHEGRVWLAMEYVAGRTLRAWAAEDPSPRARLGAWLAVGRGVAEVHRAGLVHRDIKPDNVLMGDDGRVRLVDFGLVRALHTMEESSSRESLGRAQAPASGPTDEGTTEPGRFLGTRAYAPPEQRKGLVVDARADQFSFCMSLWEALCGERVSIERWPERVGELVDVPQGARMSRRVQRALSRGLQVDPQLRFADMDGLLAELEPRRGRWLAAAIAGAGATGLALGLLSAPVEPSIEPCGNTGRPMDERWTEAQRKAVNELEDAERVTVALDDFAEDWRSAARRACEEVEVEQLRSSRSLDLRRACLDARLVEFDTVLDHIADEGARASLPPWLAQLGEPTACLDPVRLSGQVEPIAPDDQPKVAELRRDAFEVRLGADDPRLSVRREHARELRRRAQALGYREVEARVAMTQGLLAYWDGDAAATRARYGEALDLGTALADAYVIVDAWDGLVGSALDLDVEPVLGEWLLLRQEEVIRTLEPSPRREARASIERGVLHLMRGETSSAERSMRTAVARLESAGPSAQWLLAVALRNLANVLLMDGRAEEAMVLQARARDLESFVSTDPSTTRSDRGRVLLDEGMARRAAGKYEIAVQTFEDALEVLAREHGPLSLDVARAHVSLADAHDARGEVEQALRHALEADRVIREGHGAVHPDRAEVLSALGTLEFRRERFDRAVTAYERALEVARRQPHVMPTTMAVHQANLGEALYRQGDLVRAEGMLERAVVQLEGADGQGRLQAAIPMKALGEVLLERGDASRARGYLERALALLTEYEISDVEQAETRFGLARALLAGGERDAALRSARQAADEFSELGPSWASHQERVRRWIRSNDLNGQEE